MAALQVQSLLASSATATHPRRIQASLHAPVNHRKNGTIPSFPKLPAAALVSMEDLILREERSASKSAEPVTIASSPKDEQLLISKLYAIAEAVADRAEMHAIIGEQRNNWNVLFLNSLNSMNLAASIMAGIASIPTGDEASPHLLAFKISSALLFATAAGLMAGVNKIQPSQLVEEQRNATRLFKQLERSIHTNLALRPPTQLDVEEAMERVVALEKAYPLPLLPGMLEKFPKAVEPTRWWPKLQNLKRHEQQSYVTKGNGWSKSMEEEMKGVLRVLKSKDEEQYVRLGKLVLKINKALAIAGPILAGMAAVGAGLIGSSPDHLGSLPALVGVVGGALATVVNTVEHGGQVGMVFELYRNCAGFYRKLEEEIESNLGEGRVEERENGEMFELKMALQLGRSLSQLRAMASYASSECKDEDINEFAGKLF